MMPATVVVELLSPAQTLAFIEGIGAMEMMLVAMIGLLLFGGKGLPDMARTFGKMVRQFKKASSSVEAEVKRVMNEDPDDRPPPPPRLKPHAPDSLPPAAFVAQKPDPETPSESPPPAPPTSPPPPAPTAPPTSGPAA